MAFPFLATCFNILLAVVCLAVAVVVLVVVGGAVVRVIQQWNTTNRINNISKDLTERIARLAEAAKEDTKNDGE